MKRYFKAFVYASRGIVHGMLHERNVKSHFASAAAVLLAGWLTGISRTEWMIIVILIGLMIALELMNAAVERTVDLVTGEFHPLAEQAKDLAAGAVLVFACASAIIGALIFLPKWLT